MAEVIFTYNGNETKIQCNKDEKIKEICKRYITKINNDIDKIYFIYNGDKINDDLNFNEHTNEENKKRNIMKILVYDINNSNNKENIYISDEIICPISKENILINIKDYYKINLFDCKYKHNIRNIFIKDYKNTQNIDISKIICNKCKMANKSNTYNNELYICNNCNMNLFPLCKLKHEKQHKIINYDLKNYMCYKHNFSDSIKLPKISL